jgi:hypothetical protein
MLGQLCPLGTGAFDLLLNEDELAHANELLTLEDDDPTAYDGYDGTMTPGRTPAHMTPGRTPHYTPNRCVSAYVAGGRRLRVV